MAKDTAKNGASANAIVAGLNDILADQKLIGAGTQQAAEAQFNTLHRLAKLVKAGAFTSDTRVDANGTLMNNPKSPDAMSVAKFYVGRAALVRPIEPSAQTTYASEWNAIIKGASHRRTLADDFSDIFGKGNIYDKKMTAEPGTVVQKYKAAINVARAVVDIEPTVPLVDDDGAPSELVLEAIVKPGTEKQTPAQKAEALLKAITRHVKGDGKKNKPVLTGKAWEAAFDAVVAACEGMTLPGTKKAVEKVKPEVVAAIKAQALREAAEAKSAATLAKRAAKKAA